MKISSKREMTINKHNLTIQPVILCGGSGTRLWPLSRSGFPKQFLCLTGAESLFQQAAQRLMALSTLGFNVAPLIVSTGEEHRFLAAEQLSEVGIPLGAALLEPEGRNTAPALTLAALSAIDQGQDPILVVTPADQIMGNAEAFIKAMDGAIIEAAQGKIVIFGVKPSHPETGYGYIQAAPYCDGQYEQNINAHKVKGFVEKPNQTVAQQYLIEGGYYWNAGMFVLRASVWLEALENFRPDISYITSQAWALRCKDNNLYGSFIRPSKSEFLKIPSASIDCAVIEQCPDSNQAISMIPLDADWSDLGSWDAVWKALGKDEYGNAHMGDVLQTCSHNTLVYASNRLVSLVGVSDLVVVETSDAVLVSSMSNSQDVKHIVVNLIAQMREEQILPRKVHRPWGWYDTVDEGIRFKVKRIQVKPKASLSLQKHHHRAEHWIVVTGTAEITNGDKILTLTENQSTYIPIGVTHRLANPGDTMLEIIEVQSGSYLGEDDIVRLQDDYKRIR